MLRNIVFYSGATPQMKGFAMTLADAQTHAAKHGLPLPKFVARGIAAQAAQESVNALAGRPGRQMKLPKPIRMTRPEREYGLILGAMKRKREINSYVFQGLSLAWGRDPETGSAMRYKCDWLVIQKYEEAELEDFSGETGFARVRPSMVALKLIEVKGAHIWGRDLVRFKGCRSEWPMFQFEMHQLKAGVWRRVL